MRNPHEETDEDVPSNLSRFIGAQLMGKSFIIYGHLWLEHLMVRSLMAKLPNPDSLLANRTLSFPMLVSICEAHNIIEPKLADALRLVNAMRNRCAHRTTYRPSDAEWTTLHASLESICKAGPVPSSDEWGAPLEALAALVEDRARAVGAKDIEAILPDEAERGY